MQGNNEMTPQNLLLAYFQSKVRKLWPSLIADNYGFIYGIPSSGAAQVVKFDVVDKSMTEIGPEFDDDDDWKWRKGAMTASGIIYCPPSNQFYGILKIDTNTDDVTELDRDLLPERKDDDDDDEDDDMWMSCALALDGCIYFMPCNARRIMKLDPNNNDAISSVGDDLGRDMNKYAKTIVGIDGCVYGLPYGNGRILKYNPMNGIISYIGEKADENCICSGGVLARDGCIYTLSLRYPYERQCRAQVLKIDTTNNSLDFVGTYIHFNHLYADRWPDPIVGIDGCIYWPPHNASLVAVVYDPPSNHTSLIQLDSEEDTSISKRDLSFSGALATDGIIYFNLSNASGTFIIDPLGDFSLKTKRNMEKHPEELGFLFRINDNDNKNDNKNDSNDTATTSKETDFDNFDCAVTKFGIKKVLEIMEEHMPPADEEVRPASSLYPFMIAASYKECPLSFVYTLLRQVPSLIINSNSNSKSSNSSARVRVRAVGNIQIDLKRKRRC